MFNGICNSVSIQSLIENIRHMFLGLFFLGGRGLKIFIMTMSLWMRDIKLKLFIALSKLSQNQSLHPFFYIIFPIFKISCNTIYLAYVDI